jgi:hypothetical protein
MIPGFAPDKRLKFATRIVDTWLDKSMSGDCPAKLAGA